MSPELLTEQQSHKQIGNQSMSEWAWWNVTTVASRVTKSLEIGNQSLQNEFDECTRVADWATKSLDRKLFYVKMSLMKWHQSCWPSNKVTGDRKLVYVKMSLMKCHQSCWPSNKVTGDWKLSLCQNAFDEMSLELLTEQQSHKQIGNQSIIQWVWWNVTIVADRATKSLEIGNQSMSKWVWWNVTRVADRATKSLGIGN